MDEPERRAWLRADDVEGLRERFRGWESGWSPDGQERWLNWIVVRGDGEAVAWLQATVRDGTSVVAYVVLPAARRRGVAAEAVGALADWLAAQPEVNRVQAVIDPANVASQRVAARVGFTRSGEQRGGEDVWVRPR